MPIEKQLLNQTVQRERLTTEPPVLSRLGGSIRSFSDIQQLRAWIQPMSGTERFGETGRVETDVFLMVYNTYQMATDFDPCCTPVTGGPLFAPICRDAIFPTGTALTAAIYKSDVDTDDRIRDAAGLTYRVDWAVDIDGTGDHFEARLVRIRPGAETGAVADA